MRAHVPSLAKATSTVEALLAALLTVAPTLAQAAATQTSANPAAREEIVELSQFVVSAQGDDGYFAKNTLLGTRTNERLLNIPQNLQIVNSDFLRDAGFDNGIDALKYAISGANKRDSASTDIFIRGVRLGNASFLRNGVKFRGSAANPPLYDVDRIEIIKGPAALLFGLDASAGGVINYVTKPASTKTEYAVRATVGSFNLRRGEASVSGALGGTGLSYRATVEAGESDGPRKFDRNDDKFFSVALNQRISKTAKAGFYANYYFIDPIRSPGRVLSNGQLPVGAPDDFSPQESWATAPRYMLYVGADLTAQLAPTLELRLFLNTSDHDHDRHQAFAGVPNATTGLMTRTYQNFAGNERAYNSQLDFVKTFKTGPVAHKVTFGTAGKFQRLIQYVDQVNLPARSIFAPVYGTAMPLLAGRGQVAGATGTEQRAYETNLYLQEQATLLQDRVILVGGLGNVAENNRLKNLYTNTITRDRSSRGDIIRYAGIFKPAPWVSLFYSYSESLSFFNTVFPSGPRAGDFLDPSFTASDDFGVKVETSDGRFFGGITHFDMDRTNVSRQIVLPNGTQGVNQEGREVNKGWEADLGVRQQTEWGPLQLIVTYYKGRARSDNGLTPDGVTDKMWSLFAAQTFSKGPVAGLRFGAGYYHKGAFRLGNFAAPSHKETTAFVGYTWKRVSVTLNVDNLEDKAYVEAGTGTADISISPGRTWRLAVGYRF